MKRPIQQRGAVSVELALGLPLLVLVILGGVHFGRVIQTRHQLTDATNYATRAAAIARNPSSSLIRNAIASRLGPSSSCSGLVVTSSAATDPFGVHLLEVTARCNVATGIGGPLLAAVGPSDIAVTVALPY